MPSPPPRSVIFNPMRGFKLMKRVAFPQRHAMRVQTPTPSSWASDKLTLACLGHATTLINLHGTMILTDPALLDRVGIGVGNRTLGPKRVLPPALSVRDLPPIDIILVSHAHADHMDVATLSLLPRRSTVVVAPRTSDVVAPCGFPDVRELAVGESLEIAGARITAARVKHYGRRHPFDRVHGRGYNGYLMQKDGASVFFGGDTAHCELDPALGPVDVAIFGIGGYDPFVWNHATPEQAWDMARQLRARYFLPMHWGVFLLSDEPVEEPMERLLTVAGADVARIVGRTFGEAFVVPARDGPAA